MKIERIVSEYLDSNVFIVGNTETVVVIDASVNLSEIEKVVGGRKVLAVLLTHGHYDHALFANDYAKAFDCKIYASDKIKQYLKNPDWNYSEGHFSIDDFSKFEFLKESGSLSLGDIEVQYFCLGGHSLADVVFKIGKDIFVGDLLIGRDMGRIDLLGGSKKDMQKSLAWLLEEDYKIMHSGHGEDNEKIAQDKVLKLWIKFLNR